MANEAPQSEAADGAANETELPEQVLFRFVTAEDPIYGNTSTASLLANATSAPTVSAAELQCLQADGNGTSA
ncbi:hypothetical protein IscW_ISCW007615 [Ixodes scapularis]|uniref:Uncharacterized protein n=1 Tax=Ixodes scapularis TaxID=6945 RepID=B7PT73_IXOSC|nr:hypothetical protein IscW_ISCW007615 [Ixodes scapularis]|eukprot:XP_002403969.1 hypothetical protein IscW_ISCW007615 [Ixodes scapularis]